MVYSIYMELDLQSLFGVHVHNCTHWLRPRNFPPSPPPAFGLTYESAIRQPRQTTSLCNFLVYRMSKVFHSMFSWTDRIMLASASEIMDRWLSVEMFG